MNVPPTSTPSSISPGRSRSAQNQLPRPPTPLQSLALTREPTAIPWPVSAIDVNAALGKVRLPRRSPSSRRAGGTRLSSAEGTTGLTAAAYRTRRRSVLVLERRDHLGGACTLEQPFPEPGYLVGPCAYVVGMLDELVVGELDLRRHGYEVLLTDPNAWCPFPDGTSFARFPDDEQNRRPHARERVLGAGHPRCLRLRGDLRPRPEPASRGPLGTTWKRPSPTQAEIEGLLGDEELISIVFEESIADTIDRYVDDQRLKDALFGQGVIGAYAGPRDRGPRRCRCTPRARSRDRRRNGATSSAGWAGSRSRSRRRPSRRERRSRPGSRSRGSSRARASSSRAATGSRGGRGLERRPEAQPGHARARRGAE